jgi:WS/DGAT/MGAT family acyltransferase
VLRPEDLLRHKGAAVRSLLRTLAAPPDAPTSLRPRLGPEKKLAWSRPVQLTELAALAHGAGATTNDVVLAALAGALRRLLSERGERTDDLTVHAIVPVNLRAEERAGEEPTGNRFGLVYAPLPLGIEDGRRRLAEIARATGEIKRSPEAAIALLTLAAVGTMAPALNERVTTWFGKKGTLVVTNVAGPKAKVNLAGAPLGGLVFFAPQSARVGMGVSILSYAGEVRVGIATDAHVCEDPQRIVEAYGEELAALRAGRTARREVVRGGNGVAQAR